MSRSLAPQLHHPLLAHSLAPSSFPALFPPAFHSFSLPGEISLARKRVLRALRTLFPLSSCPVREGFTLRALEWLPCNRCGTSASSITTIFFPVSLAATVTLSGEVSNMLLMQRACRSVPQRRVLKLNTESTTPTQTYVPPTVIWPAGTVSVIGDLACWNLRDGVGAT